MDDVKAIFEELLAARGPNAKAAVIEAHRAVLFNDAVVPYLDGMIENEVDDLVKLRLQLHRTLLGFCYDRDLQGAFAEFAHHLINCFVRPSTMDSKKAILADWSEWLLSNQMLSTLRNFVEVSHEEAQKSWAIWHLHLLERCCNDGIEKGCAAQIREEGLAMPPPESSENQQHQLALSCLSEPDWPRFLEVVRRNRDEVMDLAFDARLAQTITNLEAHRACLAHCRESSVETAFQRRGVKTPVEIDPSRLPARVEVLLKEVESPASAHVQMIERQVSACRALLGILDCNIHGRLWATTQQKLATLLFHLGERSNRTTELEESVRAYREAWTCFEKVESTN